MAVLPHALPEPFNGEVPGHPWADWLRHFNNCATALQWTDEIKLRYLPARLCGRAQMAYDALGDDQKDTFEHCVEALTRVFDPPEQQRLRSAQYRNRYQLPTEDISAYATALRRLGADALPAALTPALRDMLILERFVDGLLSRRIQLRLREDWPANLDAAVAKAIELDAALQIETGLQPNATADSSDLSTGLVAAATSKPSPLQSLQDMVQSLAETQVRLADDLKQVTSLLLEHEQPPRRGRGLVPSRASQRFLSSGATRGYARPGRTVTCWHCNEVASPS